uniref:Pept_C1 domain-containing protein n=1 Tax=Trichuris muris TaxID=70415 RepID=A0A5S6Q365_TRIMR
MLLWHKLSDLVPKNWANHFWGSSKFSNRWQASRCAIDLNRRWIDSVCSGECRARGDDLLIPMEQQCVRMQTDDQLPIGSQQGIRGFASGSCCVLVQRSCSLRLQFSLVTASCFAAFYEEQYERLKAKLRQRAENGAVLTWKLGKNPYFKGASEAALKRLLGVKKHDVVVLPPKVPSAENSNVTLPKNFDARLQWPKCEIIRYIKDQSNCGSCWAVSTASVISDRYCIANQGRAQPFLSEEELVSCCRVCGDGCFGGFPEMALVYWATRGVPTGEPYGFNSSWYRGKLSTDRYFGKRAYSLSNERQIMEDIYANGPVVAAFTVYDDFYYYTGGVYSHSEWVDPAGRHAVRVIGEEFGENGLFRILRGSNECGIEEEMVAAQPRLPS